MSSRASAAAKIVAQFSMMYEQGRGGRPSRQACGHLADHGHTAPGRSNSADAASPPTTRTSAPGTFGAVKRRPKITARATMPDDQGDGVAIAHTADPRPHGLPAVRALGLGSREPVEFADGDLDPRTEEESRDHGLEQELGDPTQLEQGKDEEQQPR